MISLALALTFGELPPPIEPKTEPEIMQLVAAARADFKSVRGKRTSQLDDDTSFYAVKITVPGLDPCDLQVDHTKLVPPSVACDVPTGMGAEAPEVFEARYVALVTRLRALAAAYGADVVEATRSHAGELPRDTREATVTLDGIAVRALFVTTTFPSGRVTRTVNLWVDAPDRDPANVAFDDAPIDLRTFVLAAKKGFAPIRGERFDRDDGVSYFMVKGALWDLAACDLRIPDKRVEPRAVTCKVALDPSESDAMFRRRYDALERRLRAFAEAHGAEVTTEGSIGGTGGEFSATTSIDGVVVFASYTIRPFGEVLEHREAGITILAP